MLNPFLKLLCLTIALNSILWAEESLSSVEIFVDHFEDDNLVHSETAGFEWTQRWSEKISTTWEHSFDAVSGATRTLGKNLDGVSGATFGMPTYSDETPEYINTFEEIWYNINGATGATTDEVRVAEGLRVDYNDQGRIFGVGLNLSQERDYRSYSFNTNVSWDFLDRNLTLGFSHSQFFDDFHPIGHFELKESGSKRIMNNSINLAQVLTPNSLISGTMSFGNSWGYLGHPYTPIVLENGDIFEENLPDTKNTFSLSTQYLYSFDLLDQLAVTRYDYRYYNDSWGLRAHTFEIQFSRYFAEWISARLRFRYHHQSPNNFAQKSYTGEEVYRTADIRHYEFNSYLTGIMFDGLFPQSWDDYGWLPANWTIKWDHLWRDTKGDIKLYQLYSPNKIYTQDEFMFAIKYLF